VQKWFPRKRDDAMKPIQNSGGSACSPPERGRHYIEEKGALREGLSWSDLWVGKKIRVKKMKRMFRQTSTRETRVK